MASTIHCDIVSAESEIFSGDAAMVVVSGEEGELGIAPRHAPLLTRLRPGQVRVMLPDGGEEFYYISGGLLEVQPHVVTVLSDTAARAGDLDEAAALKAKEEAEKAIADRSAGMEVAQAQAQLAQAMAQLAALEKFRRQLKR
ncbi:F0F1 ATP synthase subunit epsilon [Wenzhouxiangella marina]|uniref:ATP synthase epsilon chain n=1 Tax=Wenzhouxiangella marina TaxID=1579979 RepID=A0A0K0XS74_9GAMM|nr:F0F1 ATP synthase subunit epsilon [Wenzhouxiangella marina]AKS40538.1 F0F1 ATP synthase subunit epsilon [Wenzhouxiangella marina]MBB6088138.1 F-type H+-transporting ATPase subunit epsilon [Wenzhouxiangella marina]